MSWRKGQDYYNKLVSNIGEWVSANTSEGVLEFDSTPSKVIRLAKNIVPDFVGGLRVSDLTHIHEYLMYRSEINPDPRIPTYVYSGGDRIISITRYLIKNIDLELSKLYA